jgi:hypothetical protein
MSMDNEIIRIWKKEAMACSKVLSQLRVEGLKTTMQISSV